MIIKHLESLELDHMQLDFLRAILDDVSPDDIKTDDTSINELVYMLADLALKVDIAHTSIVNKEDNSL